MNVGCCGLAFPLLFFVFFFSPFPPPPPPPTPPFISQTPAKQRGKDTEYSFLREFAASSEFSSLPGGGGRPTGRRLLKPTRSIKSSATQRDRLPPDMVAFSPRGARRAADDIRDRVGFNKRLHDGRPRPPGRHETTAHAANARNQQNSVALPLWGAGDHL
jgi:hypothetical protein